MLPPKNLLFNLGGKLFAVTYRNPGQMRFSAEFVAIPAEHKETKERFFILADDTKMTPAQFDDYCRRRFTEPPKDENEVAEKPTGNQKNVTLQIQPGVLGSKSSFGVSKEKPKEKPEKEKIKDAG